MFADVFHGLLAYYQSRGAWFFRALGEGNVIAWTLLVLGVIGFILKIADAARAKAAPSKATAGSGETACPHCSGAVRQGASYCRHCRSWLQR